MLVAQKVTTGVYKGVTTSELDELAAETAASMTASHPDYALVGWQGDPGKGRGNAWNISGLPPHSKQWAALAPTAAPAVVTNLRTTWRTALQLAARIAVSNLHKNTLKSFSET